MHITITDAGLTRGLQRYSAGELIQLLGKIRSEGDRVFKIIGEKLLNRILNVT